MPFCLTWNLRGCNSDAKLLELKSVVDFKDVSLVLLQETKTLMPNPSIESIFPTSSWLKLFTPGYARNSNSYQGGLLTLINKKHLQQDCTIIDATDNTTSAHIIQFKNGTNFCNVYQPHRIVDFNLNIFAQFDPLLVCGDFNVYLQNPIPASQNNRDMKIHGLISADKYKCCHDFYTYGNYYNSSIVNKIGPDLILSKIIDDDENSPFQNMNVSIAYQLQNFSDHQALLIESDFSGYFAVPPRMLSRPKKFFAYDELDRDTIDSYYDSLPISDESYTLDQVYETFNQWLCYCQRRKSINNSANAVSLSSEDIQLLLASTADDLSHGNMGSVFEKMKFSVNNDMMLDNLSIANSTKSEISKKCKISEFNSFESRISEQFDDKRSVRVKFTRAKKFADKLLTEKSITPITIQELIYSATLSNKTSIGVDQVPFSWLPRLRRHWENLLVVINRHILSNNLLLHKNLRTSKLTFVNRPDGNLRPISVGSRLGTIIENCIMIRYQKLIGKSPVYNSHSGFILGRNIEQLTSKLITSIYKADHMSLKASILATDVSKAYDRCSHRHIFNCLFDLVKNSENLKEMGLILVFTMKWLKKRTVKFDQREARFERGVPQGSPLSCLLFVTAMNEKSSNFLGGLTNISTEDLQYADDWNVLLIGRSKSDIIRAKSVILDNMSNWLQSIGLSLSRQKTHLLHFFQSNDGQSKSLRILGVIFDERLSFLANLSSIKRWCIYRINFFSKLRGILGNRYNVCLWRRFLHIFRNKITFGLYHLASISDAVRNKYNKLWIKCIRSVLGFCRLVPTNIILDSAKFHNLDDYLFYLLSYRELNSPSDFSSVFAGVYVHEWGANVEGRKNLRRKTKKTDIFWRSRENNGESNVSKWKARITELKEVFVPRYRCLKKQLKIDLLPRERLQFNLSYSTISEINNLHFNKLVTK